MPAEQFQKALGRLVNDENFRKEVEADPNRLVSEYQLSSADMQVLSSVWKATRGEATGGEDSSVRRLTSDSESGKGPWIYCCCCCCA